MLMLWLLKSHSLHNPWSVPAGRLSDIGGTGRINCGADGGVEGLGAVDGGKSGCVGGDRDVWVVSDGDFSRGLRERRRVISPSSSLTSWTLQCHSSFSWQREKRRRGRCSCWLWWLSDSCRGSSGCVGG
jgi:hypothetical protein